MKTLSNRRNFLAATGAVLASGVAGLSTSAHAAGLAPTPSMRGGSNNYRPGAPIVDRIGGHTTEGHERDERSHGATLTDANGLFRMDMPQIVPAFGQAHGHLAYDSDDFETVFLRPVMASSKDNTLHVEFVLTPV